MAARSRRTETAANGRQPPDLAERVTRPRSVAAATSASRAFDVELSNEVVAWYAALSTRDRAFADRALDRLAALGADLRMPQSRGVGDGLYELRFSCEGVQRRIVYVFGSGREITALTTFRKQRDRERHEVERALAAKSRGVTQNKGRTRTIELGR